MTYIGIAIIIIIILLFLMIYKRKDLKTFWTLVILITYLLFWTILSFETSPFYFFSIDTYPFFELSDEEINIWAIRGQIGDILAGHFSALAFVGIAYSLYLQNKANKQVQEEFLINNMNVKLDRYYKILDKNLEIVTEKYLYDYLGMISNISEFSKLNPNQYNQQNKDKIDEFKKITNDQSTKIRPVVTTLNFIYDEIIKIKKTSPLAYQTYIEELRLRLHSNEIFRTINTKIDEYNEIPVFDLYKEQK